ncbi:MAG: hypothetical protein EZS28_007894 [Streblomastix strix]|uniref:Uncharacterized protein n=1 Tax=Streblomastix strix TaxID=222440 RepID=A0A5J4WNQ7_9EUKA|nr:MAG: hypothetical protein EZS28_007889 [Streblomastix strix]KAA6396584.1 MAG: hypothetical protein EZS28_007894 [Streblomastix strix]
MIQRMTQKHCNQQKQRDINLEIDSEDIEIGPCNLTTRDQDMILLKEELNQEYDQDQEGIQDRETIKVQEKLEWMLIGIKMDLKPETNQEAEAKEHIEEGNMERYREAQKYNPYRKQIFSQTKNPINWNRTNQNDNWNRGEGWDDNLNDDWTKRIQMRKDLMENHNDRDSTWTEYEVPQHHVAMPQLKQPAQQTQRVQQIQVQLKQQAPAQVPKKKE